MTNRPATMSRVQTPDHLASRAAFLLRSSNPRAVARLDSLVSSRPESLGATRPGTSTAAFETTVSPLEGLPLALSIPLPPQPPQARPPSVQSPRGRLARLVDSIGMGSAFPQALEPLSRQSRTSDLSYFMGRPPPAAE